MRSGLVLRQLAVAIATQATRTTGVHVQFLAQLIAGQSDLIGVENDHVVAGIGVRSVGRLFLPRSRMAAWEARRPSTTRWRR